jgi:hypothetical protein
LKDRAKGYRRFYKNAIPLFEVFFPRPPVSSRSGVNPASFYLLAKPADRRNLSALAAAGTISDAQRAHVAFL